MGVEPINDPNTQTADLELAQPMTVTPNSTPADLVGSYADRKQDNEAIALVKLLATGSREYTQGKYSSAEDLKANLLRRFSKK